MVLRPPWIPLPAWIPSLLQTLRRQLSIPALQIRLLLSQTLHRLIKTLRLLPAALLQPMAQLELHFHTSTQSPQYQRSTLRQPTTQPTRSLPPLMAADMRREATGGSVEPPDG